MMLRSPEETLSRIVANLYIRPVHRHFVRRFLTPEDIAVVRQEGEVPDHIPNEAIYPEALIIRLAERSGWSQHRAIAEIGRGLDMISDFDYRELCEDLGEPLPAVLTPESGSGIEAVNPPVPSFSESLWLTYQGKSVKFQSRKTASPMVRVLRVFEDAGWPDEIPFPIANARDEDLHEIRGRINDRSLSINLVFSVDVIRRVISWRRLNEQTTEE